MRVVVAASATWLVVVDTLVMPAAPMMVSSVEVASNFPMAQRKVTAVIAHNAITACMT